MAKIRISDQLELTYEESGAENKLLPTEAISFVHENIFGSQFSPYEDSRHCPFPEETERFNQEADEFARSLV